jgi:DNA-binding LytR/AlgR family response regulator
VTRKFVALIIDDDLEVIKQLIDFLALTNLFELPLHATNGVQALITLQKQAVDLIFLDMKLVDMTGLELLRLVPNPPPAIAISAYPGFAVNCYESGVVDFLPKPLTYARFLGGIQKTLIRSLPILPVEAPAQVPDITPKPVQPPVNKPTEPQLSTPFIYLKTGRKTERFIIEEILYLKAYGVYTKLIAKSGTFVVNDYLGNLEKGFNSNQFMRVHKSYMVNKSHITKFNAKMLWMDTINLPIGSRFRTKVQEYLKDLTVTQSL